MKKYANYVNKALWSILLCAGLVITGCYDDSALQEQIGGVNEQLKDHESRLKELGAEYLNERVAKKRKEYLRRELESLGYDVSLTRIVA